MADETRQEKNASQLDEATYDVANVELEKEIDREQRGWYRGLLGNFTSSLMRKRLGPLHHVEGDPVPEPVDDPDPGNEQGLRDAFKGKPLN